MLFLHHSVAEGMKKLTFCYYKDVDFFQVVPNRTGCKGWYEDDYGYHSTLCSD